MLPFSELNPAVRLCGGIFVSWGRMRFHDEGWFAAMAKKVLVTEKLAEAGLARMRERGLEADVKLKMSTEELIATIPDYDALIVRSATRVTREVIEAGKNLRIIGRAASASTTSTWMRLPKRASSCATLPRRTSFRSLSTTCAAACLRTQHRSGQRQHARGRVVARQVLRLGAL